MKIAAALFALTEVLALALWYFHILPTIGVSCVVLGGLSAGLILGNLDNPGKPLQVSEKPTPPYGLGGCIPDPAQGGQSNSALLTLMKTIEEKISANKETIDHPALMARSTIGVDWLGKSDNGYDLPTATYPMEMEV